MKRNWVILIAACGLLSQTPLAGQDKLAQVISRTMYPMFTITSQDVDPLLRGEEFGRIAASNANFGPIGSGLLRPFNIGLATQLSTLPIASPASGVIFKEDPATRALLPASQSLGPILTERAETIGKGRFYAGFTRQQFRFDRLEGQPLGNLKALDRGGVDTRILQGGVRQTTSPVTLDAQIDLRLDQNVAFFTYGVTGRLDVSTALTWVWSSLAVTSSNFLIHNTGNPTPGVGGICWCAQTFDVNLSRSTFAADFGRSGMALRNALSGRSSATGIGDTLVRVKGTLLQGRHAALALGGDLRLPTGDELNYHGSGAVGFKPFAALSLNSRQMGSVTVSPHFNVGYQVSGKSVLAGDPLAGRKERLPDALIWSAGAGVSIAQRFTFMTDILGTTLIDASRLVVDSLPNRGQDFALPPARGVTLAPNTQTYSMTNGAFGFKLKLAGNAVFTSNMLVALNDAGLRDKVVPMFGLGYTF